MIIASFNSQQMLVFVVLAVFVTAGFVYIATRELFDSFGHHAPELNWNEDSSAYTWALRCTDHNGDGKTITCFRVQNLAPEIHYLNYWTYGLTASLEDRVCVQANGDFLGDGNAILRWQAVLRDPQDNPPRILPASTSIPNEMLDGVHNAHHYQRLLLIGGGRHRLAILHLPEEEEAAEPWLLIFHRHDTRLQLTLAYEDDMKAASRVAVFSLLNTSEALAGNLWDKATQL